MFLTGVRPTSQLQLYVTLAWSRHGPLHEIIRLEFSCKTLCGEPRPVSERLRMILVTGGAGFIGSNFVLDWLAGGGEPVVNLDALTYAGNLHNLDGLRGDARHVFVHGQIGARAPVPAPASACPALA